MGFIKPYLPDVDPDTFLKKPLMERMRILAVNGPRTASVHRGWSTRFTS